MDLLVGVDDRGLEDGIVIDSSIREDIEVSANDAVVGPRARRREIIAATLPRGLTPPTPPSYLDLTVGGNIAVRRIGGAAHRHGAIVDNDLELEVVAGTGHLRRCSRRRTRRCRRGPRRPREAKTGLSAHVSSRTGTIRVPLYIATELFETPRAAVDERNRDAADEGWSVVEVGVK